MKPTDKIKNELSEIAPLLVDHPIKEHFDGPSGYFDTLEDKILDRVKNEGKLVSFPLKQLLRVAAAISIFGLGLWWITNGNEMDPLASVDSDEAIEYLLEEIGQVEYNDLTDVAAIDLEHMPYDMADINSDEVDDYLNDNIDRIEYNLIDETEYEK